MLRSQIESMVDSYLDEFLDDYQCNDWGVNAKTFAECLLEEFTKRIRDFARELDEEEEEDE